MTYFEQYEKFLVKILPNNRYLHIFLAEALGTFILMSFGDASVATATLRPFAVTGLRTNAPLDTATLAFGWGFAITLAIYTARNVSGAHLNPAMTIAFAVRGSIRWREVAVYIAAQIVGAYMGAAAVFGVYYDLIDRFDSGRRQVVGENSTAAIFTTLPLPGVSMGNIVADNFFNTFLMAFCANMICDPHNKVPIHIQPALIGAMVTAELCTLSLNSGAALNPARDLGPRLFLLTAGYGSTSFSHNNYYFFIPLLICPAAAVLGVFIYDCVIHSSIQQQFPIPERAEMETIFDNEGLEFEEHSDSRSVTNFAKND